MKIIWSCGRLKPLEPVKYPQQRLRWQHLAADGQQFTRRVVVARVARGRATLTLRQRCGLSRTLLSEHWLSFMTGTWPSPVTPRAHGRRQYRRKPTITAGQKRADAPGPTGGLPAGIAAAPRRPAAGESRLTNTLLP